MNGMEAMQRRDRQRELVIRSHQDENPPTGAVSKGLRCRISPKAPASSSTHSSTTNQRHGHGTSICRSSSEHMEDECLPHNAGSGATFQFTLPRTRNHYELTDEAASR